MKRKNIKWLPLISLLLLATLFGSIPKVRAVATMYVDPPAVIDTNLQAGSKFNVSINIQGAEDLFSWQVNLTWDPSVLSLSWYYWGDFLNGSAREGWWGVLTDDAIEGQIHVNVTDDTKFGFPDWGEPLPVLIKDDFNSEINAVIAYGKDYTPPYQYRNVLILDRPLSNNYTMAANAGCYPWPIIEQAIRASQTKGWVIVGESTKGPFPGQEDANGTLVTFEFIVDAYGSSSLSFDLPRTWYIDSNLVMKSVVLSEGYFRNFGLGDANGDGFVDIFDIGAVSAHWYPGPPEGPLGYGKDADVNYDGSVDIFDIGIVSANWGNTYP